MRYKAVNNKITFYVGLEAPAYDLYDFLTDERISSNFEEIVANLEGKKLPERKKRSPGLNGENVLASIANRLKVRISQRNSRTQAESTVPYIDTSASATPSGVNVGGESTNVVTLSPTSKASNVDLNSLRIQ